MTASPDEVARIVEPPMARFLPDAPIEIVERLIGEWPLRYGAYDGRRPVGLGRDRPDPQPARRGPRVRVRDGPGRRGS